MSQPTVTIHGADGAATSDSHPLPKVFRAPIRPDIVQYEVIDRMWKSGRQANTMAGLCTLVWQRTGGNRML